jgi:hypothetical protein
MKPSTLIAAILLFLVSGLSNDVRAQELLGQSMLGVGVAGSMAGAAMGVQSSLAIMQRIKAQGYENIKVVPTNTNQYTATHPDIGNVLITVEPHTGQIISAMPQ